MESVFMAIVITLIITIVLPIVIIIHLFKKDAATLKWALTGAAVFYIFQIVLRIPALNYLSTQPWYVINILANTLIFSIFLSFTAGLFEEGGRYLAFRFILKDKITWMKGLAFGIGHGGIEAILLVGVPFLEQFITQINSGTSIEMAYPGSIILLAGFERLLAMMIHIGLSIIVLYGVKRKRTRYLIYAMMIHTSVNLPIGLGMGPLYIYIYLSLWAIILLTIAIGLRQSINHRWLYNK